MKVRIKAGHASFQPEIRLPMKKLELEDILSLEDFESQRQQLFEKHVRYLDRHRKIRIGPSWILIFENRQTLWFRVQEVLRLTKASDPKLIMSELAIYNRLLPDNNFLQAALILDPAQKPPKNPLKDLQGEMLRMHCGDYSRPSNLLNTRPEDLAMGNSIWVQFEWPPDQIPRLKNSRNEIWFSIKGQDGEMLSPPVGNEIRESLLQDLNAGPGS